MGPELPLPSAALLRDIVEGGTAAVAVLDTRLRYLYVNPRMARINGLSPADHLGRTLAEVLPGVVRPDEVLRAVVGIGARFSEFLCFEATYQTNVENTVEGGGEPRVGVFAHGACFFLPRSTSGQPPPRPNVS